MSTPRGSCKDEAMVVGVGQLGADACGHLHGVTVCFENHFDPVAFGHHGLVSEDAVCYVESLVAPDRNGQSRAFGTVSDTMYVVAASKTQSLRQNFLGSYYTRSSAV